MAFAEAASFLLGTSSWSSVVIDASAAFLLTADEGILTATEGQARNVCRISPVACVGEMMEMAATSFRAEPYLAVGEGEARVGW